MLCFGVGLTLVCWFDGCLFWGVNCLVVIFAFDFPFSLWWGWCLMLWWGLVVLALW